MACWGVCVCVPTEGGKQALATHREVDLAAAHDVIQERVDPVDLSDKVCVSQIYGQPVFSCPPPGLTSSVYPAGCGEGWGVGVGPANSSQIHHAKEMGTYCVREGSGPTSRCPTSLQCSQSGRQPVEKRLPNFHGVQRGFAMLLSPPGPTPDNQWRIVTKGQL